MQYLASCHCGAVEIHCRAQPAPVIACHCELCQRRTGSAFGVAVWFAEDAVEIRGKTREYCRRSGGSGLPFVFNFCPQCGTSLWWRSPRPDGPLGGKIAVAGGCFAPGRIPAPTQSIFAKSEQDWLTLSGPLERHDAGL